MPFEVTVCKVKPLADEETAEIATSKSFNAAWTVVAFELENSSKAPTRKAPEV